MQDAMFFSGSDEFAAWLEQHHATSDGVWIRMAKKHTGIASLDWASAVDVVLCFGWIDGQRRRIDENWFAQRFTPRRARSAWSKVNRQKVEKLIRDGRMRSGGLAEVDRAMADGRWDAAYDSARTATVPDDLAEALDTAGLTDVFAGLSGQNRYSILHRVQTAKRPETRARRIETFVAMLAAGDRPYE